VKKRPSEQNSTGWRFYRSRCLVKARQLTEPLVFCDVFGHEHCGETGDYLVEWSDGMFRIAPREFIEENYVRLGPAKPSPLVRLVRSSVRSPPQHSCAESRLGLGPECRPPAVEKNAASNAPRPLIA
jgi:hypothetical protein